MSKSAVTCASKSQRWLRFCGTFLAVFAIGVGLGAGLEVELRSWFLSKEAPNATVAIPEPKPLDNVPVRVYQPPVREVVELESMPVIFAKPELVAPEPTKPELVVQEQKSLLESLPTLTPSKMAELQGWRAHAVASVAPPDRPMIAIVLDDLGIDKKRSRAAIALPGPLTLSFIPYGYNLPAMTQAAREAGHELMVHVNMEPLDHGVDPGPNALLTSLKLPEIQRRLDWALSQFDGYTGLSNHMGSRFTVWPDGMEIVLRTLNRRGLLFLDSLTNTRSIGPALARAYKTPFAVRDIFIDHERTDAFVIKQLALTERLARQNGHAIAIGHPHDVTVNRLKQWLAVVESRGFSLVPVSVIVRRKAVQG